MSDNQARIMPKTYGDNPQGSMVLALLRSLQEMPWLTEADRASVQLAYEYCVQIDITPFTTREDMFRRMGTKLSTVLSDLGGTPSSRNRMFKSAEEVNNASPLARLRAARKD